VYGSDAGQVASHVADAIFFSGNTSDNPSGEFLQSKFISPVLTRQRGRWPIFYRNFPVSVNRPAGTSVDEYPYATSVQGGRQNYNNEFVSLCAVPISDQQRQANIVVGRFYNFEGVSPNGLADPISYFVNFAVPTIGRTFMIDRVSRKINL
jgi:hypothetical protein